MARKTPHPHAARAAMLTRLRIAATALAEASKGETVVATIDIVRKAIADGAEDAAKDYGVDTFSDWMCRLVPEAIGKVAGESEDDESAGSAASELEYQLEFDGMELPLFLAIPKNPESGEPPGWKLIYDCTPEEIDLIIARRRKIDGARAMVTQKLVFWNARLRLLGCGSDQKARDVLPKVPTASKQATKPEAV